MKRAKFMKWRNGEVAGNEETKTRGRREGNKQMKNINYT
jgi:hypothetical protein